MTRTNKAEAPDGVVPEPKAVEASDGAAPDPKALEAIGRALEAHYADLVQAPLPEKFAELLARLEVGDRVHEPKGSRDALG
ncbi:MAG: NepR family anti-sigma factor [Roseiarcus sp.]